MGGQPGADPKEPPPRFREAPGNTTSCGTWRAPRPSAFRVFRCWPRWAHNFFLNATRSTQRVNFFPERRGHGLRVPVREGVRRPGQPVRGGVWLGGPGHGASRWRRWAAVRGRRGGERGRRVVVRNQDKAFVFAGLPNICVYIYKIITGQPEADRQGVFQK